MSNSAFQKSSISLDSPVFTTKITTPVIQLTTVAAKTVETAIAYFKADGTIVSGTSTGGGMTWSGSTANGVGTYVSATCIKSNPNMTFNGTALVVTGTICATTCFIGSGAGLTGTAASLTAGCATTAGNALALCGCTPACFLGATATACCAATAGNALCLGGNLANTYAPLVSPVFTDNVQLSDKLFIVLAGNCANVDFGTYSVSPTYPQARISTIDDGCYGGNLTFSTKPTANETNALVERMRILPAGNVGIGITSPGNKLHILGSSPSYGFIRLQSTTTGEVSINYKDCNGTDELAWTVGKGVGGISDSFGWYWNGTVRMQLSTAGVLCAATCGISVDWVATSDCRLKTCIKPIMGALSIVMQLQGICYELCDDEKHENNIGLVAQDVQKVLPEIVSHSIPNENDFKYGITDEKLGLKYDKLTAVLIEAIKELKEEVDENKKEIHNLCLELNYMRNNNKE